MQEPSSPDADGEVLRRPGPFPHVQRPYISVLLDPTTAAWPLLRLPRRRDPAEPRALIASPGPGDRADIRQKLPEDSKTSEFCSSTDGDAIDHRKECVSGGQLLGLLA